MVRSHGAHFRQSAGRALVLAFAIFGLILAYVPGTALAQAQPTFNSLAGATLPNVVASPLFFKLLKISVPAGQSVTYATGSGMIYALSGSQTMTAGGQTKSLTAGQGAYLGAGTAATFQAGGAEPAVFLHYVLTPDVNSTIAAAPATVTELSHTPALPGLHAGPYTFGLTLISFPAGMPANPPHFRTGAALYYIISGTGAITLGGNTEARPAGAIQFEPYGMVHQWANPGATPLTFLVADIAPQGVATVQFGTPPASGTAFHVQVGGVAAERAIQAWQFSPATITIDAGDTVVWDFADQVYTVSFGPPPSDPNQQIAPAGGTSYDGTGYVSSGLPLSFTTSQTSTYKLTFPKPGTYSYQSLVHPTQQATVIVQPAGTPYPAAQASYQAASDPILQAALAAGATALAGETATATTHADGTTTHAMDVGFGDNKSFGLLRFGAEHVTIHAGDTVVWTQNDPEELHTTTFLDQGKDVPFFLANHTINPVAAGPAGGTVYDGTGYLNSGVLLAGKSYALTFSTPGTYKYVCLIHDDMGMKATLTVLPATSAPVPAHLPQTGGGGGALALWAALGVLGLLSIGFGVVRSRV